MQGNPLNYLRSKFKFYFVALFKLPTDRVTKFKVHDDITKGLQYQKLMVMWLKSWKTDTETRAYVQL